jgi:hypothetical protein
MGPAGGGGAEKLDQADAAVGAIYGFDCPPDYG